jgi:hypothetical protein
MLIHFAWGMGKVVLNSTKMSTCTHVFYLQAENQGNKTIDNLNFKIGILMEGKLIGLSD